MRESCSSRSRAAVLSKFSQASAHIAAVSSPFLFEIIMHIVVIDPGVFGNLAHGKGPRAAVRQRGAGSSDQFLLYVFAAAATNFGRA